MRAMRGEDSPLQASDLYESLRRGGSAIGEVYKIEVKDILVVHDEIDFVTGRLALKLG